MTTEQQERSSKKTTVRNLATELNIGHDTLIEFLQKKGFANVKSIMSKVEDDALEVVMKHFGKEKDITEKRQKKVAAFKERRSKTKDEVGDAEPAKVEAKPTEATPAPVLPEPIQEIPTPVAEPAVVAPEEIPAPTFEAVPDPAPVEEPAPQPEAPQPIVAEEPAAVEAPQEISPVAVSAPAPVEEPVAAVAAEPESQAPVAEQPAVEVAPEAVTAEASTDTLEDSDDAKGDDADDAGDSLDANGQRKRRRKRKTTVIATGDPTDLRVTLPGLKIKGKIDLSIVTPKQKESGNAQPQPKPKLEKFSNKVQGLVAKHRPDGAPKPAGEDGATTTGTEELNLKKRTKGGSRDRSVDAKDVQNAVRRTLAGIDEGSSFSGRAKARKARRRERAEVEERKVQEQMERDQTVIKATEFLTANELANLMNVDVGQIISKCIALGLMVSINQRLDKDTIQLVADEFGYTVEFQDQFTTDLLEDTPDEPEDLVQRPPVVTIMGHVDHGKTSLLDYIRKANVVAGESGGITQHIGAYEVTLPDGRQISFLDTPGHEAFTAMRARGAQVTDIVVLVIAADDNVMPQTWEAIAHAQAANVPIIIALNKADRPEANPDRLRQQLADRNVLVEEWGGKYGSIELSAKTGMNVDKLLERILLESELLELKANPKRAARGVVIEAEVDRGRGVQATILVQKGTLRMGDPFIAGIFSGRVRAMFDERGNRVEEAPPSTPVQLIGFDGSPQAGDQFIVLSSDSEAKEIAAKRQQLKREQDFKQVKFITLDEISEQIKQGGVQQLRIILKGDVDGSVEALADSLLRLSTPEVKVEIVHRAVGAITENDVSLAAASGAIILGFHVRPNLDARKLAATEHVEIRLYNVIYDCINEVRDALEGLLAPEQKEEVTATVEVRDTFKVPKVGTIGGCYVVDGKITRSSKVRLLRDGIEIFNGGMASLKRFKDDVREVDAGYECGIGLENFNDLKTGDIIESYRIVEIKRKLEKAAAPQR